ncbi:hypothetical protein JCM8097_005560 [Rhodosporidiobolus ruineniae]
MPGRKINIAIKQLAIHYHQRGYNKSQITRALGGQASRRSIGRWIRLYRLTGQPSNAVAAILRLNPSSTSASASLQLALQHHVSIPPRLIQLYAKREGLVFKRPDNRALEADPESEAVYLARLGGYDIPQLLMLDEMHADLRTTNILRAWGPKGSRIHVYQPLNHGKGYSAICILHCDGLVGVPVIEGPYDSAKIIDMLETFVFPFSNPFPGPRSVIVWDSCPIHAHDDVLEAIEQHGMKVLNTPRYQPWYQPDELVYGAAKKKLRSEPWRAADPRGGLYAIRGVIEAVVPDAETARTYMRHCGMVYREETESEEE